MGSHERSDAELLRAYAGGRESAFDELIRPYGAVVRRTAFRQAGNNSHVADEVTQQVFTLMARKAADLSVHTTLVGWLRRTAAFVTRDALRSERRRVLREKAFAEEQTRLGAGEMNSEVDWAVIRPLINDALRDLNPNERELVLLRYFAGMPYAQLGARSGVTENTARMRVERALTQLHLALKKRGVTSTASVLSSLLATHATAAVAGLPSHSATSLANALLTLPTATTTASLTFMASVKVAVCVTGVGVLALGLSTLSFREAPMGGRERDRSPQQTAPSAPVQKSERRALEQSRSEPLIERHAPESPQNVAHAASPKSANRTPSGSAAEERKRAVAAKLAEMKPLLAAGMPIAGAIIVFTDGKPVSHPVAFKIGEDTHIENVDDGTYVISPALREDGTVMYKISLLTNDPPTGKQQIVAFPKVIQTPWGGYTVSVGGGKVMAFDPDGTGP